MQAEQFGYRKSHFFFRFRQNSHAVETRLLFETCPSRSFPAAPVSGLSDLDALLLIVAVLVEDTELALGSVRCEAAGVGWPLLGCACDCGGGGGACEEDTVGFRRNRPSWPRKLAPLSDGRLAAAALFVMMWFVRSLPRPQSIMPAMPCLRIWSLITGGWLYKITVRRLQSGPGHSVETRLGQRLVRKCVGNGEGMIFCREMNKFPGESGRWTGGCDGFGVSQIPNCCDS